MPIRYVEDDSSLLDSPANVLVCPVNCRPGVMGKGLAKAFADRWPPLKDCHRKCVEEGYLSPGHGHGVWLTREPERPDPFMVYLFPTKDHWRDPSRLQWVENGLARLCKEMEWNSRSMWMGRAVKSVAIPALGCGLGGLGWPDVDSAIVRACVTVPEIEWLVYPPK